MELKIKDYPAFVAGRLDIFLTEVIESFSRSKVQKMIKAGDILVNKQNVKPNFVLNLEDVVFVADEQEPEEMRAEDLNLEIIHDDKEFLVINKPPGMVVHPAEGNHMTGTVVNAIMDKIKIKKGDRPGIVHRLDKDTSGLMIIAKTEDALQYFVDLFKRRKVKKYYLTLVNGHLQHKQGIIEAPISRDSKDRKKMAIAGVGKMAVSKYEVLKEFDLGEDKVSLVSVKIETGRTHQIRVHMNSIGHPVVGDNVYGGRKINRVFCEKYGLKRQFLHAQILEFVPPGKKKALTFRAELFDDLDKVLKRL